MLGNLPALEDEIAARKKLADLESRRRDTSEKLWTLLALQY